VRHPIYTGLLIATFGGALVADTADAIIGVALVLVAFLIRIRQEEQLLTLEFGDQYLDFKRSVAALAPFVF
jgi:protein-S-isoprenylcysteine O-methyltransferase Ste14